MKCKPWLAPTQWVKRVRIAQGNNSNNPTEHTEDGFRVNKKSQVHGRVSAIDVR